MAAGRAGSAGHAMFGRRFVFGRILGFEIRADPTWAILFLLILWSLASGFFPAMYPGVATAVVPQIDDHRLRRRLLEGRLELSQ